MDIIGKKFIYFAISLLVIVPGTISLLLFGLKPSIDFAGGTRLEYQFLSNSTTQSKIQDVIKTQNIEISSIQKSGENNYIIRTKELSQKQHTKLQEVLKNIFPGSRETNYETIGPTIGSETTSNAIKAILLSSILIVLFISWSFRQVPKPASSIRFGICAIIALLHDVLVLLGVFSLLGHFLNVEVDSLFVTAVLTVIGFSVHDTIVVFDRIRENLKRMPNSPFSQVVNASILQTLGRSLNTSLTVVLILLSLLLFGGESTKWFIVALLVGVISGTYSSIFNAAPLLVLWEEWKRKKINT